MIMQRRVVGVHSNGEPAAWNDQNKDALRLEHAGEALLGERRMPSQEQPNEAGFFSLNERRLRKDMIAL